MPIPASAPRSTALPEAMTPFGPASAAILAACVSTLLAYNVPPSSTVLNQALAHVGWGIFVAVLCWTSMFSRIRADSGVASLLAAIGVLVLASAAAPLWIAEPTSLAWSAAGTLAVTAVMAVSGAAATASGRLQLAFSSIAWAWLVAGALSLAVGALQVFAPDWADGDWIARTGFIGRAVGNLRQPNHLSSLLLWSAVSVVWLVESGALPRRLAFLLYALMLAGVVMSASRTGMIGVVLLAAWGVMDKSLSRSTRRLVMLSPAIYVAFWLGLAAWAHDSQHVFGGEARLTAEGDLSSSRFGIWANTLQLVVQHPWAGVGFGGFNFAWSLTAFPHRPVAFFDHTHNISAQFMVELGLPLAIFVLALLVHALWRSFVLAKSASGLDGIALRCAFMMVLMMALHSQLEYPLWYAYFLLPTAIAFGLCLGRGPDAIEPVRVSRVWSLGFTIAGLLVAASGILTLYDYMKVVAIFSPTETAAPLPERIARGQKSWFFSHHADYAAVTTTDHPSEQMDAFKGATHYLLDTRLMMAWAKAYAERGDLERARNIAQRLREFHNEKSDDFFAECDDAPPSGPERPFQCDPPAKVMGPEDFR